MEYSSERVITTQISEAEALSLSAVTYLLYSIFTKRRWLLSQDRTTNQWTNQNNNKTPLGALAHWINLLSCLKNNNNKTKQKQKTFISLLKWLKSDGFHYGICLYTLFLLTLPCPSVTCSCQSLLPHNLPSAFMSRQHILIVHLLQLPF